MECGKRVNWTEWRKSVKGEVLLSLNVPSSWGLMCCALGALPGYTLQSSFLLGEKNLTSLSRSGKKNPVFSHAARC